MPEHNAYPVDPMAAFYAAVTAVENGSVGEVELEFRHELTDESATITSIWVRKEIHEAPEEPVGCWGDDKGKECGKTVTTKSGLCGACYIRLTGDRMSNV